MSNKGRVLRFCKECGKKRFCTKVRIPGTNFRFECIKGHNWTIKGITLERVNLAMQETFSKDKIKNLFERDDTFYKTIKHGHR